jgi:hypothetical protein
MDARPKSIRHMVRRKQEMSFNTAHRLGGDQNRHHSRSTRLNESQSGSDDAHFSSPSVSDFRAGRLTLWFAGCDVHNLRSNVMNSWSTHITCLCETRNAEQFSNSQGAQQKRWPDRSTFNRLEQEISLHGLVYHVLMIHHETQALSAQHQHDAEMRAEATCV